MKPLPLVIIGAGSIGQRHVSVAMDCPAVDLCAVVEPRADLRAVLLDKGLPAVAALDDVPGHAKAAIVATPTADHASSASACLDRGLATLVEKPIAHTIGHAQALVAQAKAQGLPLFVGHHRRCHPFATAAREMIAEMGTLVGVQGLWSLRKHDSYFDEPWRRQPGAGPLLTNLSHEVDLLQFLLGDITDVTAMTSSAARGLPVEDTATLAFSFASGALGSFLISDAGLSPWAFEAGSNENPAVAASDEDYLRIVGTGGALAFPSLTRWDAGTPADWTTVLARKATPLSALVDPLMEQMTRFASVVGGNSDTVLCTGEDGLSALQVTLAIAYAAHRGSHVAPRDVPKNFDGIEKDT